MRTVNLRRAHLSVTAEVPDSLVRPLRSLTRQIRARRAGPGMAQDQLVMHPTPALHLQRRDLQSQIPFLRSMTRATVQTTAGTDANGDGSALQRAVGQVPWYHTIELPGGVATPGFYDHRPLVARYGIPDDLRGRRVLDAATADGFWAFEFERRGGEVTATDVSRIADLDLPPQLRTLAGEDTLNARTGAGFAIAHQALKSRVSRIERNVYDLDPADMGTFDFVHVADLLLHLESPIRALRALRSVSGGTALITDCVDPHLSGNGVTRYEGGWNSMCWWTPSIDTLGQMILDAGYSDVQLHAVYSLRSATASGGPQRATFIARTDS